MRLTEIRDGTGTTVAVGERAALFTQAPWSGVVPLGTLRTTPDAPVYNSDVLPAPYMVLARFGTKPLNSPYAKLEDFFSPHPGAVLFAFADGSARPLRTDTDLAVLRALGTRDGGEPVTGRDF